MGILPEALVNYLALLGWGPEGGMQETFTIEELAREFKLERVTPSPAVFDFEKLHWLNRHYLKQRLEKEPESLVKLAWPCFEAEGLLPKRVDAGPGVMSWFEKLLAIFVPAVDRLEELPAKARFVFWLNLAEAKAAPENVTVLSTDSARRVLIAFAKRVYAHSGSVTAEQFKTWMNEVKAETRAKGKDLFHPVRIALTGAHSGPEFDRLIPLIEEGSTLALLQYIPSVKARVVTFVGTIP